MYSQLSRSDGGLDLAARDRLLRFPAVWLRDNCPCAECVDPASKQKLKDITDIPNGTVVTAVEDAGESVVVTFAPDRHRSTFTRSWLAAHALGSSDGGDGRTEDDKDLWLPADLTGRLPEESCGPGRSGQHPGRAGQGGRLCLTGGTPSPRTPWHTPARA